MSILRTGIFWGYFSFPFWWGRKSLEELGSYCDKRGIDEKYMRFQWMGMVVGEEMKSLEKLLQFLSREPYWKSHPPHGADHLYFTIVWSLGSYMDISYVESVLCNHFKSIFHNFITWDYSWIWDGFWGVI